MRLGTLNLNKGGADPLLNYAAHPVQPIVFTLLIEISRRWS